MDRINNAAMAMGETNTKEMEKMEMEKKDFTYTKAITHGGIFHSDDIMATAIIRKIKPDITITRVNGRINEVSDDTIVYDIGGGEYDHHQKGGEKYRINGEKFSSVGLIWKDFGWFIVNGNYEIWKEVDKRIIEGIDRRDNGIAINEEYSFGDIINSMNLSWDEEETPNEAFFKAVDIAEMVLNRLIERATSKVKAKTEVMEAINNKGEGINYLILNKFIPWNDHVIEANKDGNNIDFVIFPSNRGGFNLQTVSKESFSRESRISLPKEWGGETPEKLNELIGIEDSIFTHPGLFMAAFGSIESAIKAATIATKAA